METNKLASIWVEAVNTPDTADITGLVNGQHDPLMSTMLLRTLTGRSPVGGLTDLTGLTDDLHRVFTDPLWLPNRDVYVTVDRLLDRMSHHSDADVSLIMGWRALVSILAGDRDRARLCVVAAYMAGHGTAGTAAILVAFMLRNGLAPAGQTYPPIGFYEVPDPVNSERAYTPQLPALNPVATPDPTESNTR